MTNNEDHFSISVVLPAYNCEKTIEQCLDSIFAQTYFSCIKEVIVINDGSKDNTKDVVMEYIRKRETKLIKLINQDNKGVSAARNLGIKQAKNEWIAFMDSDDIWLKDKIERQVNTVLENKNVDFLGTLTTNNPLFKLRHRVIKNLYHANIHDLCYKSFPTTPSVLVRRECLISVNMFNEQQSYSEDMNCFQKICLNYNYYILPEPLVTCGIQKDYFAQEGLSSNVEEMYKGRNINLKELFEDGKLSLTQYLYYRIFSYIKYVRRKIIVYRGGKR